ncbi:hypothetical protein NX059_010900 [Plenodomus lindquistii]|nr:hypothetical protein NX059_010900 [Plenodomus lindquistii]
MDDPFDGMYLDDSPTTQQDSQSRSDKLHADVNWAEMYMRFYHASPQQKWHADHLEDCLPPLIDDPAPGMLPFIARKCTPLMSGQRYIF